jgi:hypothetical protein
MASSITLYNNFKRFSAEDLEDNAVKLLLVTSAYAPSALHDILADVLSSPSPEVVAVASPDNGYTQGGEALASKTITLSDSPSQVVFDAANVTWAALTATFRYGILYMNATVHGFVDPLIAYIIFDTTPADIVVAGVDWTVQWSASGIIKTS